MAEDDMCLLTRRGLMLAVSTATSNVSGIKLLKTCLYGIVSGVDKCICRDTYRALCNHKHGMVVICIDQLLLLDEKAARLVLILVRRAMININVIHMVVGYGAVRERALQIGFGNIACLHDSYESFLARNARGDRRLIDHPKQKVAP